MSISISAGGFNMPVYSILIHSSGVHHAKDVLRKNGLGKYEDIIEADDHLNPGEIIARGPFYSVRLTLEKTKEEQ